MTELYQSTDQSMQEVARLTPDYYLKLPALAERLGVSPMQDDNAVGAIVLVLKDGRRYDLMELMHAFLDRMDAALDKEQAMLDDMVDKL